MLNPRTLYSNVLVLIMLILGLTSSAEAADRKVIGIVNFETKAASESTLAYMITNALSDDIVTNRSFQLLHQSTLLPKLAHAGLSSDVYEKSSYLQSDQLDGIHFLVTGVIKEASTQIVQLDGFQQNRARVLLTVRVVHVPAAQVVYAETLLGEAQLTSLLDKRETEEEAVVNRKALLETAARRALTRVSAKLHSLNPMTGFVLQVYAADNTVVIDLGSEQNVTTGQEYMIYEEGAMLVHPVTNMELGRDYREIATVRISKVSPLSAAAIIVKGRIQEIAPGLQVKKISPY